MKIAFFSDNFYPETSGISDSIITTGKELARRGHEIRFFAPAYSSKDFRAVGLEKKELDLGPRTSVVRFSSFPVRTATGQGRQVVPIGFRAIGIGNWNPDVIHVHLPLGAGLEGLFAAKVLGKPLIGTDHTPVSQFLGYIPFGKMLKNLILGYNAWFYNRVDFLSSPANQIIEELSRLGFSRRAQRVSNPVDTLSFKPPARKLAAKKALAFGSFTVLYVGRLAVEKKIDLMLKAVASLKEKIPGLECVVVGNGPARESLEELSKTLGIEGRTRFPGFLKRDELIKVYVASDVFVMMSEAETQSIAMMNALASGVPAIAARAWGLKEYIEDGDTGFLVEPGSVYGLAEKILSLYKSPTKRKVMGKRGTDFVSQFSVKNIADTWEKIYEAEIKNHKNRK